MGQFFILTAEGEVFELDATTQSSLTLSGEVTSSPIESGEDVADHYIHSPSVISMSGIITDIKSLRTGDVPKSTREYLQGLIKLKNSKQPFTINLGGSLDKVFKCVFTSIQINNNKNHGIYQAPMTGDLICSYEISFSAKQIRFAKAAEIVRTAAPPVREQIADRKDTPGSGKEVDPVVAEGLILGLSRSAVPF